MVERIDERQRGRTVNSSAVIYGSRDANTGPVLGRIAKVGLPHVDVLGRYNAAAV